MASPQMTFNALGNVANAIALAAGATSAQYLIDSSTDFETQLQANILAAAAVATTNGVVINVYRQVGVTGTVDTDTMPSLQYEITPLVASTASSHTLALSTGRYIVTLTNTDATNGVTFTLTTAVVSGIA